jgi:hypothetical protein
MAKRKSVLPPNYDRLEGKHFLAVAKETVAGLFATYDEARQARDELFPTSRHHPESGTHVEVCYHPTRKQLRRLDRRDRALNAFHVTYWQVVQDMTTSRGRVIGYPLSKKYSTRQECRAALARIKGGNPRAYIGGGTYLCHPGRLEDIELRNALLAEMRGLAAFRATSRMEANHG